MIDYEILILLDPELSEEQQEETIGRARDLIEKGGGTVDRHDVWGRRKLAYEIDKKGEGELPPAPLQLPAPRRSTRSRACSRSTTRSCVTWRHVATRGAPDSQ